MARTAEAARRYAQMKGLGHEAVNYATGIKAQAMLLLAQFVDEGQATGTVRTAGRPENVDDDHVFRLRDVLGTKDDQQARDAVRQARGLRDALGGQDVIQLVKEANESGDDLGIRGLKRMAAEKRGPEPVAEPVPPPDGVFPCIAIDPPWPMKKIERDERPAQGVALDYPTMPVWCQNPEWESYVDRTGVKQSVSHPCSEDIGWDDEPYQPCNSIECLIASVLHEKAAADCHLYLWVTHRFLPDGIDLLKSWGFTYQCLMTWRKNVGITPFSWMYDTEHVIFARRGSLDLTQLGLRLSFDAPVAGHSVKPDAFYERVTAASPGPRLEMFARQERNGFTAWGNEVLAHA